MLAATVAIAAWPISVRGLGACRAAIAAPAPTHTTSITGGAVIAYQSSAGELQTVTPDRKSHRTGIGLAPATSPSIAAGPSGQYEAVGQAGNGTLWAVSNKNKAQAQHVKVVAIDPESNPSTGGGSVDVVSGGLLNVPLAMNRPQVAPGSSPSISYASGPKGTYQEADAWEHDDSQVLPRLRDLRRPGRAVLCQGAGHEPGYDAGHQPGHHRPARRRLRCDASGVSAASLGFDLKDGHTYEIRLNGAGIERLTCADTAQACPLKWTKVIGDKSQKLYEQSVDVI